MKIFTALKHFFTLKKIIIFVVLIALLAGGYFLFFNKKSEPIEFIKVARGDIKSTVSTSGILTGKDSVDLKFSAGGGKLAYINVKEGDSVKKGQIIAGLDTQELSIALQQAQNNWLSKDATAKRVEDDVKNNETDEDYTERETRIAAQTARDNAYDALKSAKRDFQDGVLYAPIAGVVTKASPLAGQFVSAADLIAQIVDESEIYFDAEVDESDIGKVQIGQTAEVTLNSYPDKTFKGTVEKILPTTKTISSGATVVVAKIKLEESDITFVHGINGQAEIITEKRDNVLFIPQEVLKDESVVLIKDGEGYKEVTLETGLSSDADIEVKSGLSENQEIVKNPQAVKTKK